MHVSTADCNVSAVEERWKRNKLPSVERFKNRLPLGV